MSGKVGVDYVIMLAVQDGDGDPVAGIVPGNFTPRVRALDTGVDDGSVASVIEIGNGRYSMAIRGAFTTAQGAGNYGWSVSVNQASPFVKGFIGATVEIRSADLDDVATDADMKLARHRGAIWIDEANGSAGTTIGVNGTPDNPVDTLADAVTLAAATGFREYRIRKTVGGLVLASSHDDWVFIAEGEGVAIGLANQDVDGTKFIGCELSGQLNGTIRADDCLIDGVTDLAGTYRGCRLRDSIGLLAGASVHMEDCASHEPAGGPAPIVSFTGAGSHHWHNHRYSGPIEIRDMTNAVDEAKVQLVAGSIRAGATNTAGLLEATGIGTLDIVGIGVGVTVDDDGLHSNASVADYLETTGPNPHGTGAWDATATIPLQDVRDAMKLAPSPGAPAAGSIDEHLDGVVARTDGELVDVATFLGTVLGTPVTHTPTTVTAGGQSYTIGIVGTTVTITRNT